MNRIELVRQIDDLLNNTCDPCPKRIELYRIHGKTYSLIDGYCNKECPIGALLQTLGQQLQNELRRFSR